MASPADDMIATLDAFNPHPDDAGTVHTLYTVTERFDSLSEAEKKQVVPHMFSVMERGWEADLGSPGPMVHAIETLGVPSYLSLLIESVRRRPTYLNLWMVNRILNVTKASNDRTVLLNLLRAVGDDPTWADVSEQVADFLKHQDEAAAGKEKGDITDITELSVTNVWHTMSSQLIEQAIATFRGQKQLAERAMVQLTDDQMHAAIDADTNSVAVIVKHMAGNMRSRWTDLLTTDGEKPDRDRDDEFVDTFGSRAEITARWEAGWACVFGTLGALRDDDLGRSVTTRGEASTVASAILRQVSHYGYHVGQIVLIARVLVKDRWEVLTIPKGGSRQFNERMASRPAG